MSSPSPAAKTVGRDTAWGRVNGAIEDVSSTVCGRPDEVAGGGVGNRDESDRAGVDRPGVEQPATSSPTAATAYDELFSRAGGFRRGILRSMELTRTSISPRSMPPDGFSSCSLPRSAYATKRGLSDRSALSPDRRVSSRDPVCERQMVACATRFGCPTAAPEAANFGCGFRPRSALLPASVLTSSSSEGQSAKDWRTL